jgi:tight adherence protein B
MLFIVILVFAAVFLLIISLANYCFRPQEDLQKRMKLYIKAVTADFSPETAWADRREPLESKSRNLFRQLAAKYGKGIEGIELAKRLEIELRKGDIPLRGYEFVILIAVLIIACIFPVFLWNQNPVSMTVAGLLGLTGPLIYLRLKQQQKMNRFNNQIGDALVMVSNSLKAGYGFLQAVEMVAKEMTPPIRTEFGRVIQEINLGLTTEDALIRLTERVPSSDLDLVVTAMLIQRQIGGNLSEILDNISQTIRERIRIKGEVKALTAQGRLSGLIIGILPVGIGSFLLLVNPNYIMELFTDPRGRFLLVYAVIAQLIALLIIRKIITIRV